MTTFKIGTRASPLALAQAHLVRDGLTHRHPYLLGHIEIVPMTTSGDTIQDRSLIELGGKSLFTKEIEEALLKEDVDIAVHSLKDMPFELPEDLTIGAVMEREDVRDVVITSNGKFLKDLEPGSKVGTSSLRRQAQILHRYPHFEAVPIRGNVGTRLQKIEEGYADATLLALAGLNRLSLAHLATEILSAEDMIPAVGQGAIAIESRKGDRHTQKLLEALNHRETWLATLAERAFMREIEGSCRTPLGAYAEVHGSELYIKGFIASPNGQILMLHHEKGAVTRAQDLGKDLGIVLKKKAQECNISY
ncbi:Porphobilinogen deaminase [Candidatus Bealeia paramacronuclearis]|uniref:Porphobilinogen deaminase n=1 Tax=Candidatus Bealeia paramacronuclearis TaxID=1921001 RepID=A0ABZ2C2L7_9PROT|nr:Porphobilinogen deaminase [Candidatus Bealeia paramacronuclearis]